MDIFHANAFNAGENWRIYKFQTNRARKMTNPLSVPEHERVTRTKFSRWSLHSSQANTGCEDWQTRSNHPRKWMTIPKCSCVPCMQSNLTCSSPKMGAKKYSPYFVAIRNYHKIEKEGNNQRGDEIKTKLWRGYVQIPENKMKWKLTPNTRIRQNKQDVWAIIIFIIFFSWKHHDLHTVIKFISSYTIYFWTRWTELKCTASPKMDDWPSRCSVVIQRFIFLRNKRLQVG